MKKQIFVTGIIFCLLLNFLGVSCSSHNEIAEPVSPEVVPMPQEVFTVPDIIPAPEKTGSTEVVKETEPVKEPEVAVQPEVTDEPKVTDEPERTGEPEATDEPKATGEPPITKEPEVTKEPEITKQPETPKDAPPTYQLQSILKEGQKFTVAEEQKWDGRMVIAVGDQNPDYSFLTLIKHEYTDEIMSIKDGLKVKREYTLSQKKTNLPNEGTTTKPISFHKKAMVLEIKNGGIKLLENLSYKEGDVLSQDFSQFGWAGDFNGLLPTKAVTVGEQWNIDSESLARAAMKNYYRKELCQMSGTAQLTRIVESQGIRCAEVIVKINLIKNADDETPALDVMLDGFCYFALDDAYVLTLELTGPFKMSGRRSSELNEIVETTVTGVTTIKLNEKLK